MLRQLYILVFLFLLQSCTSDSDSITPADLNSITGTWRLIQIEKGGFGQKYWESAVSTSADYLIFRADGVVLDADSLAKCCGPTSFLINNQLFEIKPSQAVTVNPLCAVVNCASCPTWEIQWKQNELIISYCDGSREKYARL